MKTTCPTGGQSVPAFDHYMAVGVAKTFIKELVNILDIAYSDVNLQKVSRVLKKYRKDNRLIMNETGYDYTKKVLVREGLDDKEVYRVINKAIENTEKQTYQAMEALVHNLNSMHSRAGSQVPFSALNYGTDISTEGRMVMKTLLKTTYEGLGDGETPLFP